MVSRCVDVDDVGSSGNWRRRGVCGLSAVTELPFLIVAPAKGRAVLQSGARVMVAHGNAGNGRDAGDGGGGL